MSNSIKIEPNNYISIKIDALIDSRLSFKAKGLYALLRLFNNDTIIKITKISKFSTDGNATVLSAIKELLFLGYIKAIEDNEEYSYKLSDTPDKPDITFAPIKKLPPKNKNKKSLPKYNQYSVAGNITKSFYDMRKVINPIMDEPDLDTWQMVIGRMIFVHGKQIDTIRNMIRYIQYNPFWKNVILTPFGLEKNYDKIELQMYEKSIGREDVFEKAKERGINKDN